MFGAIAGGIASALAGGAMSKLFGGGQKAASGGIQGDVLATDNNTVGMGDAGIKSAIQGSNVPNPDEAVPSFVSGAMAKAGKGLLEGTLQAGTSAVSDKLLDLVGLGGKSAADKGKDTRDYLAAAFPELNAWERAGADASSAGMVDAGFENQKELTKMQLDNQKEIAEMQNETQKEIADAAFLGTINPDTNKIPKHLFQGYLNIYNNYFKAPWMPDRTEANPNELNQDDARYGFRCCHLKNIWTAPLPPETELSRQMRTSTTSIDIMGLQAAYANLHTDQERDYFMQRYHDVISSFGGKTSYDADNRPLLVMRSNLWASGYDVDGTDQTSLGQFSGRVQQTYKHSVPRFFVPEHGTMFTLALVRFPPTATKEIQYLNAKGALTYTDIAGDPVLYGNLPPREISMKDVFRSGDSSK